MLTDTEVQMINDLDAPRRPEDFREEAANVARRLRIRAGVAGCPAGRKAALLREANNAEARAQAV